MDDEAVDRILAGKLNNLPPVSSKIVRIFTSSTFTDTSMERNTLMEEVYPRLKEFCREKHGLEFQVVDMRWGVRDEATDDHMTTELCMKEIENCQRLSMGPNFVVFLGQKYGYRPIPTYILASELQMVRDALVDNNVDASLLDKWYKKDSNAVPPVCILQPISSILVNFNNKRVAKLQAQDQATWWDTLGKMQKLLRKGAQTCFTENKMDKDAMHSYFMSVTEREVINGVLNVKNTKNHTLAYVRYINNINLSNLKAASKFVDIINRAVDTEATDLLANLRDERLPAKIETSNLTRYTVEWIGKEGLEKETHGEYLQHFITSFQKNIMKLVDRAMRKEDSSPQGQIVTEILQHLHACNNSVKVFYGRDEELCQIEQYIKGACDQPFVLYGAGGCGKTSLLAKSASMVFTWLANSKPLLAMRFMGTTPDSSTLAPLLTSLCKQIAYNYMLPMEGIPEDLVPLMAYLKNLLCHASAEQPLMIFLDSVDQLSGIEESNKMSWIPVTVPAHVKFVISCNRDEENSRDFQTLVKMIEKQENFLEVKAMGEELAIDVIKRWLQTSCRDLNNYQWRVVQNVIAKCTLPLFVKLVFAEICRWKSYSKPQETLLASTVNDSIMKLYDRIELQHGKMLVFHALAYITASKSGLSETELEDLISLDDKVLDDVYQYHMPPVRRIPPLLWTRIRNDLPNYLSEREADGVNVMNWYHRQFKDAARERYFKNLNLATYFHSSIADYFLGTWGGGTPKPFRYTEIQRHRFGLTEKEGSADRKVPLQPLVFYSKDGKVSRYNVRKFGELPYHLVRSRRFADLCEYVLFNYNWLHAKLHGCPLQAVLSDFEDAHKFCEDKDIQRAILLVADAMRLGGAIISEYPDMLGPQLIGRLLPEMPQNENVKKLLKQCDSVGPTHCALLPTYHSLHTPGGPLKYSLEGHQFAVFAFCLTSDKKYILSVSNRFIMWDMSTSDITRNVNPEIEGIMQSLVISPDNRRALSCTSCNQIVLLNVLTGEAKLMEKGINNNEAVVGIDMNDTHFVVWGQKVWSIWDFNGKSVTKHYAEEGKVIHSVNLKTLTSYDIVYWSGNEDDTEFWLQSVIDNNSLEQLLCHNALVKSKSGKTLYASVKNENLDICVFQRQKEKWELSKSLGSLKENPLQLAACEDSGFLVATIVSGFHLWNLSTGKESIYKLPHGVRNIPTMPMRSNTAAISRNNTYVIAGIRKVLYVWDLASEEMLQCLDAHFGRIIQLTPLINTTWNCVITSSIDRSVKVWNINNIFEQVHTIDRHEMGIDSVSVASRTNKVLTVTRNCIGIWNIRTGKLCSKLADSQLGAIITHADITKNGKYIVSIESENFMIWDADNEVLLVKDEHKSVKQLALFDEDYKVLVVSRESEGKCRCVARGIPTAEIQYEVELPQKAFRQVVFTSEGTYFVVVGFERGKDYLAVYNSKNGNLFQKITPKYPNIKDILTMVPIPRKATQIALIDAEKGNVIDVKSKRFIRSIPRWNGIYTQDGKYGLYAPNRGGLELIELKYGNTVKTFIPRVAEGVFTVKVLFTKNDDYVLYYHSGRQTIRVFRVSDASMLANYKLSAELNAMACASDGVTVVLGTVDGCLTGLMVVDPIREESQKYLANFPSRSLKPVKKADGVPVHFRTTAQIASIAANATGSTSEEGSVQSKACEIQ